MVQGLAGGSGGGGGSEEPHPEASWQELAPAVHPAWYFEEGLERGLPVRVLEQFAFVVLCVSLNKDTAACFFVYDKHTHTCVRARVFVRACVRGVCRIACVCVCVCVCVLASAV